MSLSSPQGHRISLQGHRILIAEDEPLVALDLALTVESTGATAVMVHTLEDAIAIARVEPLSAAIVDMKLKNELASPLCALLQCLDVPFVVYSGYDIAEFKYKSLFIPKPTPPAKIIETLISLSRPIVRSGPGPETALI